METPTIINFWTGCRQFTTGCKNCYVFAEGKNNVSGKITRSPDASFIKAIKWTVGKTIVACDASDFFLKEADEWRKAAWDVIRQTPQHKWFITTKWPERILACLPPDWADGWENVYFGVSIQTNQNAAYRIPLLFNVPIKNKHYLVVEPILEPIDLKPYLRVKHPEENEILIPFAHVILSGETGPNARPSQPLWYQAIMHQCKFAQTPVYLKQLGSFLAKEFDMADGIGADFNDLKFPPHLKTRQPYKEKISTQTTV